MNDEEMIQAVIESADVFLNGELPRTDPSSRNDARLYAKGEAERFQNMLESYLYERQDERDYATNAA
jgi:hypothetical protein